MNDKKGQITIGDSIGITVSFFSLLVVIIFAALLFSALKDSDDFLTTIAVANESQTGPGSTANVSLGNDRISTPVTNVHVQGTRDMLDPSCTTTASTTRCGNYTLFGTAGKFSINLTTNNSAVWHFQYTYTQDELGKNASLKAAQGFNQISGQASNIGLILAISIVLSILFSIFLFIRR